MNMMRYPKVEGVFRRNEEHQIIPEYKCPEFDLIKKFLMFEKVDGSNAQIKISYPAHLHDTGDELVAERKVVLEIFSRNRKLGIEDTSGRKIVNALKPVLNGVDLKQWYIDSFVTPNVDNSEFVYPDVRFFGEAYGPGIQKRGKIYRKEGVSFILFDIHIGNTWLNWENVKEIGKKLSIPVVPEIMPIMVIGTPELVFNSFKDMLTDYSTLLPDAPGGQLEGFILRPEPMILNRHGQRLVFKIKRIDYGMEKE